MSWMKKIWVAKLSDIGITGDLSNTSLISILIKINKYMKRISMEINIAKLMEINDYDSDGYVQCYTL